VSARRIPAVVPALPVHSSSTGTSFYITKHLHDPPSPLDNLVADLDANLGRLVLDCLAKNPAQRPGSARELLERLEGCPTRGGWTRERAQAWWNNRTALLCRASKPMAAAPMALAQTVAHLDQAQ
jgi:hypothetical protein